MTCMWTHLAKVKGSSTYEVAKVTEGRTGGSRVSLPPSHTCSKKPNEAEKRKNVLRSPPHTQEAFHKELSKWKILFFHHIYGIFINLPELIFIYQHQQLVICAMQQKSEGVLTSVSVDSRGRCCVKCQPPDVLVAENRWLHLLSFVFRKQNMIQNGMFRLSWADI
ncbi:uncharacterized protein LOC144007287 isoform X2 [Festucalex cinctus]